MTRNFVPSSTTPQQPFSEEYHQALIEALALDSSKYAHVDQSILHEFEQLLRKYPTAFLLSGSPLGEIHGFEHHIETDDALPVYKHPNRKKTRRASCYQERNTAHAQNENNSAK